MKSVLIILVLFISTIIQAQNKSNSTAWSPPPVHLTEIKAISSHILYSILKTDSLALYELEDVVFNLIDSTHTQLSTNLALDSLQTEHDFHKLKIKHPHDSLTLIQRKTPDRIFISKSIKFVTNKKDHHNFYDSLNRINRTNTGWEYPYYPISDLRFYSPSIFKNRKRIKGAYYNYKIKYKNDSIIRIKLSKGQLNIYSYRISKTVLFRKNHKYYLKMYLPKTWTKEYDTFLFEY